MPLDGKITDYVAPVAPKPDAPLSPAEVLRRAKRLIRHPDQWTTHIQGRTASGNECDPESDAAVQWCAHGAVMRVAGFTPAADRALHEAAKRLSGDPRMGGGPYNNSRTHAEVMGLFDLAIKIAEKRS